MTERTIILTLGATTVSSTTTLNMEGIMDRIKIADIDNERYYQVPVAFLLILIIRIYQMILKWHMLF